MTTVYNEDIREFILERYEELGRASAHMRALHDARRHGKFTQHYTTEVRDTIAAHLEEHFEDDPALPDLSLWDGLNTPQRIYRTGGGTGLAFSATQTSGFITSIVVDTVGVGYTHPPVLTLVTLPDDAPTTEATLRPIMGEVISCSITAEGDDYTSTPTATVSAPNDAQGTQATMTVRRGKVSAVSVTAGGTSYDDDATVIISTPDTGTDTATADITVESGVITSITLTHPGSGYTSSASLTINSTSGSGATLSVSIDDSAIAGCSITLSLIHI